jgi:hypothetical protein
MRKAKNPQQMRPTRTEKKVMPQTKKNKYKYKYKREQKKREKRNWEKLSRWKRLASNTRNIGPLTRSQPTTH